MKLRFPDSKPERHRARRTAGRGLPAALLALSLLATALALAGGAGAYTIDSHDDPVTGKLAVSPAKVELQPEEGSSSVRDITVTNQTGETVTIMFSIENFQGSDDPSEAFILAGDEDDDGRGARYWLESELDSIVLKEDESITFRVTVDVPEDSLPGGYYAALVATVTDGVEENDYLSDEELPVSLFLIRVNGDIYEVGDVDDLRMAPIIARGPVDIGIVFSNRSDAHVQPEGRVRIINIFGQQVAEIPVDRWVVMPDSVREKMIQWQNPSLFGRFTAEVELDFGPDDQRIVASKTFWVISWPVAAALLVVVVVIVALIVKLARSRRRSRRPEPPVAEPEISETREESERETHIPLNRLFPSMEESRLVDVTDPETRKLCASLISNQVDLAQAYVSEGRGDRARQELREARAAAMYLNLLSEIAIIDAMLSEL